MQAPKDRFSSQSAAYRQFRPQYPPELYAFLLNQVQGRERAWDCGTGNGQVASQLAGHFAEVAATDISQKQLQQATPLPNVHYSLSRAEQTPFPDRHFNLITVAQALHWFDFVAFFAEVQRVARPGALLAVWGYGLLRIGPAIDALLDHFYMQVVGPYWDAERRHIDAAYTSIPFPFAEMEAPPPFAIRQQWHLAQVEGYLSTWSAVRNYQQEKGANPLPELVQQLSPLWGAQALREVRFPIFMRLARL
ncbi:class I SAM-dependent methyltransferase [Cesiribacter andamanensis]|uniref:Ubiquinone/menaquinone biosynthesis methyltransferase n=1 Tax=Cesiribacter andamanensis AMV16 TaxID=1279009 RepID=M7N445_9BACT|nr:class I SAM-dependent methyltransferase [Cesiribacter andamanensis]EMR03443.1 ubiquinone/menaquinone biosynthesis methyltransferase [Cesiribacter andamanensis AMV16]